MNEPALKLLANEHCQTGENPLWDAARNCVFWTDIPRGKMFRYELSTDSHRTIYNGDPVGGFTLQSDGNLLLFRVHDIAILRESGEVETIIHYTDDGMERFNDVTADPEGRVFAGTIGKTKETGGLYRVDRDGSVTKLFAGTRTANGMGFSPDLRTFYWTCSTTKRLFAFDYERASGELKNRRVIYQAIDEGTPDGMAMDADGNIWSARWDGFALVKHSPDGSVLDKLSFPVAKVSCPCFGGPEMKTLFVTTAGGQEDSQADDGALFSLPMSVRGAAKFPSKILI